MKTLREILKKYCNEFRNIESDENIEGFDFVIAKALKEIDAYYKSKVPKKKEIEEGLEHLSKYDEDRGWNLAVDDFNKAIK